MSRLTLRFREWLADRSGLQYPRPRLELDGKVQFETRLNRQGVTPVPAFRFSDFVIAMKALALATVCLLVAIPLLALCGLLVYAFLVAI